jgi:2,4-dienoyl-CoA reductase-like NADH-dependent reductase (Old Yellow Enzyme family)
MENRTLFDSYHLKALSLKNRIVMAPMTRARALQPGNVPSALNGGVLPAARQRGFDHYRSHADFTSGAGILLDARSALR